MIWSARMSSFDDSWRALLLILIVPGCRQLDLLSRLESRVLGLTLISRMIRLEDGALGQILISEMTDSALFLYSVVWRYLLTVLQYIQSIFRTLTASESYSNYDFPFEWFFFHLFSIGIRLFPIRNPGISIGNRLIPIGIRLSEFFFENYLKNRKIKILI